jgi:hypothetical protein
MTEHTAVTPDSTVPKEAGNPPRCPYCDRPFPTESARDLHRGEDHPLSCTESELDAYESAKEAEEAELFYFHIKVVAALGILYAGVVLLYMVALGSGFI